MTLLGIGGAARVASAQPRHDGHARRGLGQHRDPGSGPAHRARHALRRSRHRQPEDLRAERAKDPRRHRPRRDQQERPGRRRHRRRSRGRAARVAADARAAPAAAEWLARIDDLKGDSAVRDIQNLPDDGHLYAAHVIHDLWRDARTATRSSSPTSASTRCGRRSTTTTSGRARSSRRAGSARWASRCRRRSAPRSARPDAEVWVVVGDGGFQMTMASWRRSRRNGIDDQDRDHQQRLPRHGAAVAGVLLRAALRRDAAARARTSSSSPARTASAPRRCARAATSFRR